MSENSAHVVLLSWPVGRMEHSNAAFAANKSWCQGMIWYVVYSRTTAARVMFAHEFPFWLEDRSHLKFCIMLPTFMAVAHRLKNWRIFTVTRCLLLFQSWGRLSLCWSMDADRYSYLSVDLCTTFNVTYVNSIARNILSGLSDVSIIGLRCNDKLRIQWCLQSLPFTILRTVFGCIVTVVVDIR